ncbi:hypothetical protein [Nonomuraea typhae]|uniref:hypothetical protein n=1 Tax=Nonomuraea typhae TaxID=2603600 RepID=UPI0012F8FAA0|nr:hypothetical protein [Nonomuraea typhae]
MSHTTPARSLIAGAAAALVLAAGGAGMASAAAASTPTPAPSDTSETPAPGETTITATVTPTPTTPAEPPRRERLRAFGGIRSEVVVPKEGGGYQTVATHTGEVTAAAAGSITVKSEDGFSRTYAVADDTRVNAGPQGVAGIKTGDTVHVTAVLDGEDGEKGTAQQITDLTRPAPAQPWAHGPLLPGPMPPDAVITKRLPGKLPETIGEN